MYKKIVKYCIYALVFLMPLFWLPFTAEKLEFNKGYLLLGITALGVFSWVFGMIFREKSIKISLSKMDLAVLAFLAITGLSVIFAKDRGVSIFGEFGKFWPSLIGLLSAGGFYFLLKNNVGKEKEQATVHGIIKAFLISTGVVVLTAFVSAFGLWARLPVSVPEIMRMQNFNTAGISFEGLSMFLAFIIALLAGLTALQVYKKQVWLYALMFVSLAFLVLVDFWPAWFALCLAMVGFFGFALWKRIFKENINKLAPSILLIVICMVFMFTSPLRLIVSENETLSKIMPEILLRQRASWDLTLEGIKENPVLGTGVGNFSYGFSKFKPQSFLQGSLWQVRLNRAGSYIAESITTTGILGIVALLAMILMFILFSYKEYKQSKAKLVLPILFAFIALVVAQFVYYQNTILGFSFWLTLGLGAVSFSPVKKSKTINFKDIPELGLVFSIVFYVALVGFGFLGFQMGKNYTADMLYNKYLSNPSQNLDKLEKAAHRTQNRTAYHIILAKAYLSDFVNEVQKPEPNPDLVSASIRLAVEESKMAILTGENVVEAQEMSAIIYREIQGLAKGAEDWAIISFEKALELEPNNPAFLSELGKLYLAKGEQEKAELMFEQAVAMKPDYMPAVLQLASIDVEAGRQEQAIQRIKEAIEGNPYSFEAVEGYFRLGMLYYNNSEFDLAEQEFANALQIFPQHSNSLYSLALIMERKGDIEQALILLDLVLQLNPGNEEVLRKIESLK